MAREFAISIPIAGHAFVTVEADSEEEAIDKAFDAITIDNIEEWEALRAFNEGYVCYCPQPWEIDVQDYGEIDEEPTAAAPQAD